MSSSGSSGELSLYSESATTSGRLSLMLSAKSIQSIHDFFPPDIRGNKVLPVAIQGDDVRHMGETGRWLSFRQNSLVLQSTSLSQILKLSVREYNSFMFETTGEQMHTRE